MQVSKIFDEREQVNEQGDFLIHILDDEPPHVVRVFAGRTRDEALGKMRAAGYKEHAAVPVWKGSSRIPAERCSPFLTESDWETALSVFPEGTRNHAALQRLYDEGAQVRISYDVQCEVNKTFSSMMLPYRIYVAKGRILKQFKGAEVVEYGYYYLFKGQKEDQEGSTGS